nr:MAG TPA: hypothetical protein [Caudoviricetes sp.]
MPKRTEQIPIAIDQLVNTLFGGWADETISSVAWRKRNDGKGWVLLQKVIDAIFFWQKNHCESAYLSEKNRLQCPPELREKS